MTDNFAEYVLCMNSFLNHYRGFSKTGIGYKLPVFHESSEPCTFLHVDDGMNRIVVSYSKYGSLFIANASWVRSGEGFVVPEDSVLVQGESLLDYGFYSYVEFMMRRVTEKVLARNKFTDSSKIASQEEQCFSLLSLVSVVQNIENPYEWNFMVVFTDSEDKVAVKNFVNSVNTLTGMHGATPVSMVNPYENVSRTCSTLRSSCSTEDLVSAGFVVNESTISQDSLSERPEFHSIVKDWFLRINSLDFDLQH
jgi:hypothetical protein